MALGPQDHFVAVKKFSLFRGAIMSRRALVALAGLGLIGCVAGFTPARADIVLVDASTIQGANVLFNTGVQTGTTVTGFTQAGTLVDFTGTTLGGGTTIMADGGQARIEGALDTSTSNPNDTLLLTSVSFNLASGGTFNNLEFNVFGGTATSVNFSVLDNQGDTTNLTGFLDNGSGMFGVVGIHNQTIASITISSINGDLGFLDLRQIRLDETTVSGAVPEASTWAMLILGFAGIGFMGYRRKSFGTALRLA
jgi:hypothetical protein